MKKLILGFMLILSVGCALQTLEDGLPYLVGKPIDSAVDVLGLPSSKMTIGKYTVYEWTNENSATIPMTMPSTSFTSGNLGTSSINTSTTSYSTSYIPVNNVCVIKLSVDDNEIINRWEFKGNQGGCQYYTDGIKRLMP